ncbi:MAG: hypothetical protein VB858_22000 [Planctomycetaceae bacterium]
MDKTREQAEPQITPGTGLAGDVNQLKTNATATAEELREFVSGLKGRSPQEVLGIVSETGLFTGIVQATIGCVILVAALTVLPWAFAEDETETPAATAAADTTAEQDTTGGAEAADATTSQTTSASGEVDPAAAVKAMGEDEVKPPDATTDPLDNTLNNLLELKD